jgi:hypothetical protein
MTALQRPSSTAITRVTLVAGALALVVSGIGTMGGDDSAPPKIQADSPALKFVGSSVLTGATVAGCGAEPSPITCGAAAGAVTVWVSDYGTAPDPSAVFPLASKKWRNALNRY